MTAATKASVLALARRLYGSEAWVRHDPLAPNPADKATQIARRKVVQIRLAACRNEIHMLGKSCYSDLVKAARFAVDVAGQDPSMKGLGAVLARAERFEALRAEEGDLVAELKELGLWRWRWEAGHDNHIRAWGSTLDEVRAKLEATP